MFVRVTNALNTGIHHVALKTKSEIHVPINY